MHLQKMRVYYCSHLSRSFSGTSYHYSVVKVLYVEADSILSVWCCLVKGEHTQTTDGHFLAPANRLLKGLPSLAYSIVTIFPLLGEILTVIYDENYKPNQMVVKRLFDRVNAIVLSIKLDNIP
jgi:hypothetical protein